MKRFALILALALLPLAAHAQSPPATGLVHRWIAGTGIKDAVGGGSAVTADGATIARWEDQVGSAHLLQSTSGSRPTWDAKRRAITFNEGADQRLAATIDSRNQNSVTMAVIAELNPLQRGASGTSGTWQGSGTQQYQSLIGGTPLSLSYAGDATYTGQNPGRFTVYNGSLNATSVRITSTLALYGMAGGSGNVVLFENDTEATVASNGSSTFTDFAMAGPNPYTGATHMIVREAFVYDHQLDGTERAALNTYAQRKYGVIDLEDAPQRIIQMGDSIGSGNFAATQRSYFRKITEPYPQSTVYNFAESDNTFAKMQTEFSTIVSPILTASSSHNVVLIEGGTNDLHSTTPAATYANLATLCSSVRAADPAATIIVSTVTPRTTSGDQTDIDAFNVLLRAEFNRQLPWVTAFAKGPNLTSTIDADFLWDVAADPVIGPSAAASDTDLYTDGLHPTTAGHRRMAESLTPLFSALCANLVDLSATTGVSLYVRFDNGRAYDLKEGRGIYAGRYTLPISAVYLPDGTHAGAVYVGTAAAQAYTDEFAIDVAPFNWRIGLHVTAAEAAMMDGSLAGVASSAIAAASFKAGAIDATAVAADAIGASELAADAIGAAELADSSIDAAALASDAITAAKIATDAIGASEMATDSIGNAELASDAIGSGEIQADAIGSAELALDAIGASELAANAIGAAELADSSIDAAALAADAVTAAKMAADVATEINAAVEAGAVGTNASDAKTSAAAVVAKLPTASAKIAGEGTTAKNLDEISASVTLDPQDITDIADATADAVGASVAADVWAYTGGDRALSGSQAWYTVPPTAAANATALLAAALPGSPTAGTVGELFKWDKAALASSGVFTTVALANAPSSSVDLTPEQIADLAAAVVDAGGEPIPVNQSPVPELRTWQLVETDEGLHSLKDRKLRVGDEKIFAVDFTKDLPTNGRLESVESLDIVDGTAGGVTFASSANDPGVDKSLAKTTITAVTAGTYDIEVEVTSRAGDGLEHSKGIVTLIVTE